MPSKLRKAIGAVKDQTSIGLAKVSNNNSSNLGIAVLKATTHDEVPIDERCVNEVLLLISSNKVYSTACAQAIAKRIGRTRNWIVALKSLMLVLRIFQDGDPYFPREVLHAMKHGAKILNLSSFRDDSNSSPWDYTAFVRTFALYLDERLDCFLTGKLQRRVAYGERENHRRHHHHHHRSRRAKEPVRDMKPAMLLDKISYWQRLLDRAIATRPTGAAKTNRIVQISLYAIVQESFDLYRDISDGLALLLDSFFHLKYQSCVNAFQTCVKASKQFEELSSFYILCKSIGVGRTSEYPSVQKISDELIETLQEFLKDQASFPTNGTRSPAAASSNSNYPGSTSERSFEQSETTGRISERDSDFGSQRTSLEDLISATEAGTSPSTSLCQETFLEQYFETQSLPDDLISVNDTVACSSQSSLSVDQRTSSAGDLVSFDDRPQQEQEQAQTQKTEVTAEGLRDCWELVLAQVATQSTHEAIPNVIPNSLEEPSFLNGLDNPSSLPHQHHNNPFLQDTTEITAIATAATSSDNAHAAFALADVFSSAPTFQAIPTFRAENPNDAAVALHDENDPFAPCSTSTATEQMPNGSNINQQNLLHEQQLWLQHQNKIIAKHLIT